MISQMSYNEIEEPKLSECIDKTAINNLIL